MIRVHGDVRRINVDALDHKQVHGMVYDIMNDTQRKNYEEFMEIDFSFEIDGLDEVHLRTVARHAMSWTRRGRAVVRLCCSCQYRALYDTAMQVIDLHMKKAAKRMSLAAFVRGYGGAGGI